MIRPLRRAHRVLVPALGAGAAVVLIAALSARGTIPALPELDPRLTGFPPNWQIGETRTDAWSRPDIRMSTIEYGGQQAWLVEFTEPLELPDLLLYASAETPGDLDALPPDAMLLGAIRGGRAFVDRPEGEVRGLILYSLGHQNIVATSSVSGSSGDTEDSEN